jgi:O-antigen/teichoic acid export membrane protein
MNIMSILLTFKATFVAFWSPVAMQKYEEDPECRDFFKSAFNITRMLCVLAGLGMVLFRGVIILILGPAYTGARNVIPFLTLMPVFSIMFEITNQGIKFKKKNRYLNYASIIAIICNIAGNLLLVPLYKGAGAALATAITYVIYYFIGTRFSEKCFGVGYGSARTLLYAAMLLGYSSLAVFGDIAAAEAVVGAVLVIVVLILERKNVAQCIDVLSGYVSGSSR